jgi:hypothetical protein
LEELFEIPFGARVCQYGELRLNDIGTNKSHNVRVLHSVQMLNFAECILTLDTRLFRAGYNFSHEAYALAAYALNHGCSSLPELLFDLERNDASFAAFILCVLTPP